MGARTVQDVCAENERDHGHVIGSVADDKKLQVKVASEILKQYVGVYELQLPPRPPRTLWTLAWTSAG